MTELKSIELPKTFASSATMQTKALLPRIYINSFPKSGTHLANLICQHIAQRQEPKYWLGSFLGNSWTTRWFPNKRMLRIIYGQPIGTWYQGHMGYKDCYRVAFEEMNVCMLFIYRDPRDVAVSQTYHIENSDDKRHCHPNKQLFMDMKSHEERLKAVIRGINRFKGVMERWELYAPWLDVDWVLPIKYEEMREDPKSVAENVISYIIERTVDEVDGFPPFMVGDNIIEAIIKAEKAMGTTKWSTSYRKGVVGSWQEEFTPEHKELFRQTAGDWLEKLGYEENKTW